MGTIRPKTIVRHKETGKVGFVLNSRKDLGEYVDVQLVFDNTKTISTNDFKELAIANQICCKCDELLIAL